MVGVPRTLRLLTELLKSQTVKVFTGPCPESCGVDEKGRKDDTSDRGSRSRRDRPNFPSSGI